MIRIMKNRMRKPDKNRKRNITKQRKQENKRKPKKKNGVVVHSCQPSKFRIRNRIRLMKFIQNDTIKILTNQVGGSIVRKNKNKIANPTNYLHYNRKNIFHYHPQSD